MGNTARDWPLAEAKAKFSELVDLVEESGAQYITRRGRRTAVLVPLAAYEKLLGKTPERNAVDWLLAPEARVGALPLPDPKAYHWRKPPNF